jgi:hypothetical protein
MHLVSLTNDRLRLISPRLYGRTYVGSRRNWRGQFDQLAGCSVTKVAADVEVAFNATSISWSFAKPSSSSILSMRFGLYFLLLS